MFNFLKFAKTPEEKAMQRALLQYYNPQNKDVILKALKKCGRFDLIGNGEKCLVKADKPAVKTKYSSRSPAQRAKGGAKTYGKKKK